MKFISQFLFSRISQKWSLSILTSCHHKVFKIFFWSSFCFNQISKIFKQWWIFMLCKSRFHAISYSCNSFALIFLDSRKRFIAFRYFNRVVMVFPFLYSDSPIEHLILPMINVNSVINSNSVITSNWIMHLLLYRYCKTFDRCQTWNYFTDDKNAILLFLCKTANFLSFQSLQICLCKLFQVWHIQVKAFLKKVPWLDFCVVSNAFLMLYWV